MATTNLGIQRIASLHVFVRDLERSRDHYVSRLDFAEIARSTREFEMEHRARASVVQAGGARFVFLEPLGSRGESYRWLENHPEGIGRVVFDVADAERAYAILLERGATPTSGLERRSVAGGAVVWFDIATPLGDTTFRFIEHQGSTPLMPDLARIEAPSAGVNRFGFGDIDHFTVNHLTMKPAILWMEQVMGWQRYWETSFHTQDVRRGLFSGSGLRSIVLHDAESGIKVANNEPAAPYYHASQIYLFCRDHRGAGIQHVALTVRDITTAVRGLRDAGVRFMPTPGAYYDALPERLTALGIHRIDEDIQVLRNLEILVDGGEHERYLLQIFLREAAAQLSDPNAGPLFLEIIQRKGDPGFGAGNFRALFESIERQQLSEGRAY